jgi:hypothetical protein
MITVSDLNYEDKSVSIGDGIVYWRYRHVGVRLEGFGFAPIQDEIRTGHRHWGVRGGAAFSFG